jgi:3-dehydroquinate synthase
MTQEKKVEPSKTVRVALGERSYSIQLGTGTLSSAGIAIAKVVKAKRAVIITDKNVGRRYAKTLQDGLDEAGFTTHRVTVPAGDATKNLDQMKTLYDKMLRFGADRSTVVVALGGGMVGDLAGFLAASFLRGIPFVQVPTTVLSMVDASIGGKVGVNLSQGKNLVGAFHQPKLVWIDTATLGSLPQRERAAGLAEVVKAGAIWDAEFFAILEKNIDRVLTLDADVLLPILARSCAIKAEVVARDERESNLRMLLNFGHTMAHPVETLNKYEGILHGEAVAMGMVYAARRSEELALAPAGTASRIEKLLQRINLPTELPKFSRKAYLDALGVDKKKLDAHIQFVVLREIGQAETRALSPVEIYPKS